jgi:hypothetical protein
LPGEYRKPPGLDNRDVCVPGSLLQMVGPQAVDTHRLSQAPVSMAMLRFPLVAN